jgi:hypothetical protein
MGVGDINFDLPDGESFAPDPLRVSELKAMMPSGPFHLGVPATERAHWDLVREHEIGRQILRDARAEFEKDPRIFITDEIYLECLEKKDPAPFNTRTASGRGRISLLILAECLEPTGEYLPAIIDDINRASRMKSWIHPGNDTNRDTFEGRSIFNDLASVHLGSSLVAAEYLLGKRLPAETRRLIRSEVRRRVLDPFRRRIESGKDVYWWVTVTHNWNSVCVLYTTACALALLNDADDRAWYLATAAKLIRYSEDGFEESGFYTEGVGYWIYGFGSYTVLAEIVRTVTGGRIDWMSNPLVDRMTRFGRRMEIQDGVYPSFADCRSDVVTPAWLDFWMYNRIDDGIDNARQGAAGEVQIDSSKGPPYGSMLPALVRLFHQKDFRTINVRTRETPLREWFDDVQFLICRPRADARVRFASTFMGGHNGVNHNHNDLGSFSVVIGSDPLLTDPGAEVYTRRTFSERRYESNILNSYGHSVPVVAGCLQSPGPRDHTANYGSQFHATLIGSAFSDDEDHVVLDLKKAYELDSLERLTRSFTHNRTGDGHVMVVDQVEFARPETFETALITFADWDRTGDDTIRISQGSSAIDVRVTSDGGTLVMDSCVIEESSTPTRLAWRFREPVQEASVRFLVKPV